MGQQSCVYDIPEDGFETQIFELDTLDEHLILLNRVHLQIPHIP